MTALFGYMKLSNHIPVTMVVCLVAFFCGAESVTAAEYVPIVGIPGLEGTSDFNGYINALYALSISLAALIAVVKIVLAGAKYMLSDLISSKSDAKNDIQNSLIGLLIIIGAVVVLNTINTDLTDLRILDTSDVVNIDNRYNAEQIRVQEICAARAGTNNPCPEKKCSNGISDDPFWNRIEPVINPLCEPTSCRSRCEDSEVHGTWNESTGKCTYDDILLEGALQAQAQSIAEQYVRTDNDPNTNPNTVIGLYCVADDDLSRYEQYQCLERIIIEDAADNEGNAWYEDWSEWTQDVVGNFDFDLLSLTDEEANRRLAGIRDDCRAECLEDRGGIAFDVNNLVCVIDVNNPVYLSKSECLYSADGNWVWDEQTGVCIDLSVEENSVEQIGVQLDENLVSSINDDRLTYVRDKMIPGEEIVSVAYVSVEVINAQGLNQENISRGLESSCSNGRIIYDNFQLMTAEGYDDIGFYCVVNN